MPCCMLRVLGDSFSADSFLANARLPVSSQFTKGGRSHMRSRTSSTSGFNCEVSTAETLSEQVKDAMKFLEQFQDDLARIAAIPTVESFYLDFGYDCRLNDSDVIVQKDFLPAELLRLVGLLGMGVCLTLFPALKPEHDAD